MRRIVLVAVVIVLASAGQKPLQATEPTAQVVGSVRSEQLVVLDPGHGGGNTGAPGFRAGLYEKQVTLQLARKLAPLLEARGFRVVLTRDRDLYLSLRQRVAFANAQAADLFISLHLNASPEHNQRGYETYLLTARALQVDGRALRLGDGPMRDEVDPATAALLDDVERGLALPESAALAVRIQRGLRAVRGKRGDRGVKQSSMDVLLGATMPAVLVEVGFIDHPVEGAALLEPAIQDEICQALATAIVGE